MKEYDVKITETLEKTVTVQAESHDAAEEQVRAAYYNSEYILDSENFTGVAFGTTEEREVQKEQADTMNVLLVKPFMYPQAVQIGCELEDLQKAVGGDIEATYPFNEPVALVMHDEGKLVGKELNRALRDDDGDIYDIIAGDFLVVGLGEDDFCSLSPELMKQFEEHFHQPETFVRMGRSIMALLKVSPVVFSPTICASREDLLQSMYWLFLMKGGGDIYDCETEYARSRMEQKLGVITVEEFLEKILVN